MDVTPIPGGLAGLSGGSFALLIGLLLITFSTAIFVLVKGRTDFRIPIAISIFVIGVAGTIGAGAAIIETAENKRANAVKEYVTSLGFEIKDGEVAVNTGTDKEMTVSKNGEDFTCTSYAPDSADEKIFMTCDTAVRMGKGTIEDLSAQLNGMKIRADAAENGSK